MLPVPSSGDRPPSLLGAVSRDRIDGLTHERLPDASLNNRRRERCELNPAFVKVLKAMIINSPLSGYVFPRYRYWLSPPQLCFLCQCIAETHHIEGAICEVGCATGWTTVFLNKYMDAQNIEKAYYAVDTFRGFVPEDIDFEVSYRGKKRELYTGFATNSRKWFDKTMQQNKITRVRSIEADVNRFDLRTIGPICFALVDVDLYRPMKKGLQDLYEVLSPGGIVVADDCYPSHIAWDGSGQAYKEVVEEIDQPAEIVHGKFGVIRKPLTGWASPQTRTARKDRPGAPSW
jgi:O-methyltransferase